MSGSKKISELAEILSNDLAQDDYLVLVDTSETLNKKIKVAQLDARFLNEVDFDSDFNSAFSNKSTDDLSEGTKLYYNQSRFDTAFSNKSTDELVEGTKLYYTEARVSSNADVSANTDKRHNILTLSTQKLSAEISLNNQELSATKADSLNNGYLDKSDFTTFAKKANASINDISESSFLISENVSTSEVITGLSFDDTTTRSFEAIVSIEIEADTNLSELVKVLGVRKGDGSWAIEVNRGDYPANHLGDDTDVEISFVVSGGNLEGRYVSGTYTNFVSGTIRFRAETLTR